MSNSAMNSAMFSPSSLGSLTPPHSAAHSFSDSPSSRGVSPPTLPSPSTSYPSYLPGPLYPSAHSSLHHQAHKYEAPQVQKYEAKYDGSVPTFDLGNIPKYDSACPTKFEPKFEPKYEPNLSVENSHPVLVGETPRAMLAPENTSISMTLMQWKRLMQTCAHVSN